MGVRDVEYKETVLVLDFGTSNVRANLVALNSGAIVESFSIKNQWIHPHDGWAEMDADTLWESAQAVVEKIVKLAAGKYTIPGMGFSFFGDSLIITDKDLNPLHHMIMAFDTRAQDEAEYLGQRIGAGKFRQITGGPCLSMLVCSKLLWFKNHEPELFKKAGYFLNIQEFILGKMGLTLTSDYTLAGRKALFDITEKEWSEELLGEICIQREKLGKSVQDSTDVVGRITEFGRVRLPYEIPVVLGAHDSECGFLGLGVNPDDNYTLGNVSGTYEMIGSFSNEYIQELPVSPVELGCGLLKNNMVVSGSSIAGSYVQWFQRELWKSPGVMFEELEKQICYDGKEPLYFLADNDKQRSILDGLTTSTNGIQIYQALIEGITFKLKTIIDEMEQVNEVPYYSVMCGGGGARSYKWIQFKSDLFQKNIKKVQNAEVSSVGAAIITAVGIGYYQNFNEAINKMVQVEKIFIPDKEVSNRYQEKYLQYKEKMK